MRNHIGFFTGGLLLLCAAVLATQIIENEYVFFAGYVVLQFIVLATGWNVMGGYAGYVNFGSAAFFAVGAYTAAALLKAAELPLGLQILAAVVVTGALGFAVGVLTLRLRGIFFSIATVAIAVILETVVLNWSYVGGARGMTVLPPDTPYGFSSYMRWLFVVMALLAVLAVAVARYVETSWIGHGLRALRDDETAAESLGVPTLRLKTLAATISGALMGMAGAPYALYLSFIEPTSVFNLNYARRLAARHLGTDSDCHHLLRTQRADGRSGVDHIRCRGTAGPGRTGARLVATQDSATNGAAMMRR
jgi:branched-chain amino acid transport system permease protein